MRKRSKPDQIKRKILDDLGLSEAQSYTQESQIDEHVDALLEYESMKKLSRNAEREVDRQHCRKQLLGLRKELSRQRKDLGLLNNSKPREEEVADFFKQKPKHKPKQKLKVLNAGNKRTA